MVYKDFNSETDFVDHKMDNIEVYLKPMEMTIDSDAKNLYKDVCKKVHKDKYLIYLILTCHNKN
jgi:hypothetical protein